MHSKYVIYEKPCLYKVLANIQYLTEVSTHPSHFCKYFIISFHVSARSLTSTSSVIWRSGRGLQWQPVKLWWTPCPRGLKQCWKIMVAQHNIDTLGPIWTFSLRGVLTFVASGLDINGCVMSYFEGTETYTVIQAVHSLLFIVAKCNFFSVVTWKNIIKYLQKCEGCTHFCEIL